MYSGRRGDRNRLFAVLLLISCVLLTLTAFLLFISHDTTILAAGRSNPSQASETILSSLLSREEISFRKPGEIRTIADVLVRRSVGRGRIPERFLAARFPSAPEILAMLARDRDMDDYLESAAEEGAGGDFYQHVLNLAPSMKPLGLQYEALFLGTYSALTDLGRTRNPRDFPPGTNTQSGGVTLPGKSSKPTRAGLDLSHTYALDIFYRDVSRNPASGLEQGPVVLALENGIVIAASSSWTGGEDLSSYRRGGIAPKAGNGVIVYSPRFRRYYLYFHLHDAFLRPGDAVSAGQPLGRGGNTGTNARKPGHGEHLHLEVFDIASGCFLRNTDILKLVFD